MLKIDRGLLIAGVILVLGGCSASNKPEAPAAGLQIRQSTLTAPADLQLLCSAEVAKRTGLSGDQVIPVRSSVLSPMLYQVEVMAKRVSALCIIDENANIVDVSVTQGSSGQASVGAGL